MSERAEQIFADALEVDRRHRDAFVAEICRGDEILRAEVGSLLRDANEADTFFASLTHGAPGRPDSEAALPKDRPGTQIGSYRLVRPLGQGGFGKVWLAEQEEPIRRFVALKLIKRGMDSEEVIVRFRAEQQALAMMDHPGIARVFDAGFSPDDRPFFAMEFVDGIKITQFCDEHRLSISERLGLFLQVCAAVNHAHQKGIIHRDLKPSNILVTPNAGNPQAKVIDFGIAKALDQSITGGVDVTRADHFIGTPTYMSPEQAGDRRADVDTRTDVYSLGVILYELLVGKPPFDESTLARAGWEEIWRIIREEEPPRPSTKIKNLTEEEKTSVAETRQVATESLPRLLGSELDWIVMKAIDKSKEGRYGSAEAFSEDLSRLMRDEPVMARPPSKGYLLAKFARRHRGLLWSIVVTFSTLAIATTTSLWLAFRAVQAEQLADARLADREEALAEAEAVASFLVDVFRRPDPNVGSRNLTAVEVLKTAEEKLPNTLEKQPEKKRLIQRTLAETYQGMGSYLDALRLRRELLDESVALHDETHEQTLEIRINLADLLFQLGYYEEALGHFEILESALERKESMDAEFEQKVREGFAACLFRTGQHERASQVLESLNKPTRKDSSKRPPPYEGKPGEKRRIDEVRQLQESIDQLRATRSRLDLELLQRLSLASRRMYSMGERKAARDIQQDLVERYREKYGLEHMMTIDAETDLAHHLMKTGRYSESNELRADVIKRRKQIFGPEHLETLDLESRLAQMKVFAGRAQEAYQTLSRTVPLLEKVAGSDSRATLNAKSDLGRVHAALGDTGTAIATLQACSPKMPDDSFIAMLLSGLLVWTGRHDEYEQHRERMIEWMLQTRDRIGTRADIRERLLFASCLLPLKDDKQAQKIREILDACLRQREARNDLGYTSAWLQMAHATINYRLGNHEEAIICANRSLEAERPSYDGGNFIKQTSGIILALARAATGDSEARDFYQEHRIQISDPPSEQSPLLGSGGTEGEPLKEWILRREADAMFQLEDKATATQ